MEEYAPVEYCKICKDKETDLSRGSAFVCFQSAADAARVLQEAYLFVEHGIRESSVELNGRQLILQQALSRDEAASKKATRAEKKHAVKDSRNVSLVKESYKTKEEYEALGLSPKEIKLRMQAQMDMNRKLKNVNFVVNRQRVVIRNLPKNASKADVKAVVGPFWSRPR